MTNDADEEEFRRLLEEQARALEDRRLANARLVQTEARLRILRNGRAPTIELMTSSKPQPGSEYLISSS